MPSQSQPQPQLAATVNATMMDYTLVKDYRAAVALNNLGIAMLQRRAYRESLSTFKDAMKAMHSIFQSEALDFLASPSSKDGKTTDNSVDVDRKLQRAMRRLRQIEATDYESSVLCPNLRVDVVTYEEVLERSLFGSILKQGPSSTGSRAAALSFRIEATSCCSLLDKGETDVQAAMMLYNYAVVHLILSRTAKKDREYAKAKMWRQGSVKLLSRNIALSKYALRDSEHLAMMQDSQESAVILSLLIIATLILALNESGQSTEAETLFLRLVHLRDILKDYLDKPLAVADRSFAAAAA